MQSYKNFIMDDPIIDFLNINGETLGYIKDSDYPDFDKELLLDYYIKNNKKVFAEKIKNFFEDNFFHIETNVGKAHFVIRTNELYKYFVNYENFTGQNFSLFTVEYSTLKVSKKGDLLNSPKEQRYYNFKNWMMLKECEKNKIPIDHSFVLGRKYTCGKEILCDSFNFLVKNNSTFEKVLLDYNVFNSKKHIIGKSIFPNMKNKMDFPWHNAKKKISDRICEITSVRGCSVNYRNSMVEAGIMDYHSLDILYKGPDIIVNELNNELPEGLLLFIDFEILTNIYDDFRSFPTSNSKNYIFNIGCGYQENDGFGFETYAANELHEEVIILQDFVDFINDQKTDTITFVHWTDIEKRSLTKAISEYNLDIQKKIVWFDLCDYFIKSNVKVKGCLNYKLKCVSRTLFENGLISSEWDKTFSDGLGALTGYLKYLKTKDQNILDSIVYYNKIDCKVMWEIYNCLKKLL